MIADLCFLKDQWRDSFDLFLEPTPAHLISCSKAVSNMAQNLSRNSDWAIRRCAGYIFFVGEKHNKFVSSWFSVDFIADFSIFLAFNRNLRFRAIKCY